MPAVARAFTLAGMARQAEPLVAVVARSRDAEALAAELEPWLPPDHVTLFPAWEVLPGEAMSPTLETMGRRVRVVDAIAKGALEGVIVTSIRALLQKTPQPPDRSIVLRVGTEVAMDTLSGSLVELGYERNYLVERPGEFSIRGGILDVFPPGCTKPVRADFFGDEISDLRGFSVSSQRSGEHVEGVELLACRELRPTAEVRQRAAVLSEQARGERKADLDRLADGLVFAGMEGYLGVLGGGIQPITTFLPGSSRVVLLDPKQCQDRSVDFLAQAQEWGNEDTQGMFASLDEVVGDDAIELWPFARGDEVVEIDLQGWDEFVGHPDKLVAQLEKLRPSTLVVAAGPMAARATDILAEAGMALPLVVRAVPREASVSPASVHKGFLFRSASMAVVGESDLFGRRRALPSSKLEAPARASALLLELVSEDHVVHETYGVGRYHGMVTREVGGVSRDYLIIEYHGDDRLYLPTEQLEAITRYTGGDSPRLNRLGTGDWEKSKTRARKAVADIAGELMVLYSKRIHASGHPFAPDTPWQAELENAFAYLETPDQDRTIEEVKGDMERATPMDRLICGDVGYGKTEVAVRAAFKAVQDSKQVAVLVPTTILAQQHTQTFSERYAGFPIKVAQLSRFLTHREQAAVLEGAASGKVDVVIGTHRLLQSDVKFHDLGLLVVDEEQRFGVKHKERIKQMRENVDALTMTATPIPRTLEMGITGIRDLSLMDTPPVDRRPVLTYVGEAEDRMVIAAIRRELARDGQVFYVHNRVRSIRGTARRIAGLVPGARIEIAHGQMSEGELEKVMVDVWDGKVDVLVCTTIIESGLDIPAMNTLIVERADLLGLAQLYQLRGRVGRARERAYAYFFYPHEAVLTDEAHERLKVLSEFTELGSGFKIALRDLEIRGAGNLLGSQQSGHIAAIGFDLYMKMMSEAVAQLTQREPEAKISLKLELPADAFVPASYISRESLRMDAYRQIEKIRSPQDGEKVREELVDRYGPVPASVDNLLVVAEVRAFLSSIGVEEAIVRNGILKMRPWPLLADSQEVRLARKFPEATYKQSTATLLLPVPASNLAAWVLESVHAILAES